MAFDQSNFAPVGANSTDTPKIFSYKTSDSLATVLTSGYFDAKRFQFDAGDIILADISGIFNIIQVMTATPTVVTTNQAFPIPSNQKTINALSDFPAPVGGVITTDDDTFYLVGTKLPDTSDRFVLGKDTVIAGLDSSASSISYSGTGTMFTSVDNSNKITLLTLDCPNGKLHDISATGPGAVFQFINCTVSDVDEIGNMSDLTAIQYSDVAFNNIITTGITFEGAIGIFIGATDLVTVNGATPFFDLGTATFDSFDISASLATLAAGASFISGLADSGNITSGNSGSLRGVKTFGTGTPLVGITVDDVRWFFSGNDDIPDTRPDGFLSLTGNTTATVVSGGVPALVAGTWVVERVSKFVGTAAGRLTSKSERPNTLPIIITTTAEAASGSNKDVTFFVFINGVKQDNSATRANLSANDVKNQTIIFQAVLNEDDFVELFVANNTDDTSILVEDGKMVIN